MNKLHALLATLSVMTTAVSANAMEPTQLADDDLDKITAGLNIDTTYFNLQTNCSNCIIYDTVSNGRKVSEGFALVHSFDNPDGPARGVTASYAGPLHIVGAAFATGSGPSDPYAGYNVLAQSFARSSPCCAESALAYAGVRNGTAATVAYNGPLGIVQAGAGLAEGEAPDPYSAGASSQNPSLLSINGLGGVLVLPTGGGRQAAIEGRLSIGAPGL